MEEMTEDRAIEIIWDYMHMRHKLVKADVILVLGGRDTRVAEYAATLYLEGWASLILFAGSGSVHNHKRGREQFVGSTEADVFANIARAVGVPDNAILIENKSQNTGENFMFSMRLLHERGIDAKIIIAIHKPYMERRTYATGMIHVPKDTKLIVTSPPLSVEDYAALEEDNDKHWIHRMVGDLQRLREYPKQGFQIEQNIPVEVWSAYEFLVTHGYTKCLIS